MKAPEEHGWLQSEKHNSPATEAHFQQPGGNSSTSHDTASMKLLEGLQNHQYSSPPTTPCEADYVKILESYVVQLKLENNVLRLWTGL